MLAEIKRMLAARRWRRKVKAYRRYLRDAEFGQYLADTKAGYSPSFTPAYGAYFLKAAKDLRRASKRLSLARS